MSILSEINRIKVSKENIKNAIINKGGTITSESIDDFANGVLSIPSGGSPIPEFPDTDPLTFVCILDYSGNSSVSLSNNVYNKSLFYNKNDEGWENYIAGTKISLRVGEFVRFKSTDTKAMASSNTNYGNFLTDGVFKCYGNVMSLLNNTIDKLPINALRGIFRQCNITKAPSLPATSLSEYCYESMFRECKMLTTAPELPATTLANKCYHSMFAGCTKLTSVKTAVTSWNTSDPEYWLSSVASSGTVYCPANSTIPTGSTSGIPTGWTRVDWTPSV